MAELIEISGNPQAVTEVKNVLKNGSRFNSITSSTYDHLFKPFTSGSYAFNTNLANRKMTEKDRDFLGVLKLELSSKPPQNDVVLFRGIREKTALLIGDQVSDRAVMSKSTQIGVSLNFAMAGTLMILRYPESSLHVYLEPITNCKEQYEVISYPGELFEIKAKGKIKNGTIILDLLYAEYSGNMYKDVVKVEKIFGKFDNITSKLNTHFIVVNSATGVHVFRGIDNPCQKGAPTTTRGLEDFLKNLKINEIFI